MGFRIVLLTGDHRGTAAKFCAKIGIECTVVKDSDEKARAMTVFDRGRALAIGNARIDSGTFVNARLRIATLQAEGIHTGIPPSVDVVAPDIDDARRMLLDPHILRDDEDIEKGVERSRTVLELDLHVPAVLLGDLEHLLLGQVHEVRHNHVWEGLDPDVEGVDGVIVELPPVGELVLQA